MIGDTGVAVQVPGLHKQFPRRTAPWKRSAPAKAGSEAGSVASHAAVCDARPRVRQWLARATGVALLGFGAKLLADDG